MMEGEWQDLHGRLRSMSLPDRQRLLCFEENAGIGRREREFYGPFLQRQAAAPARSVPWNGEIWTPSTAELNHQLLAEQACVLGTYDARCPRPGLWLALGASSGLLNHFSRERRFLFPLLPWAEACEPDTTLPGRILPNASFRSAVYFASDPCELDLKIHAPTGARFDSRPAWLRWLGEVKRRVIMNWWFGVDARFDGGSLEQVDALHSLVHSARMAEVVADGEETFAMLREVAAGCDPSGRAFIIRERQAWPPGNPEALLIPLFSVLGPRENRGLDLLLLASRSVGQPPVKLAVMLGRSYLLAWWWLLAKHGLIFFMPHAQNAMFELLPDNRIGRLVLKDMRDVDHWSTYCRLSSRSTRLIATDRAYLRYEMAAHPLYFDAFGHNDLASAVFNYSFQMLRNYVLRGFATALSAMEPQATKQAMSAFTHILEAMSCGQPVPGPESAESGEILSGVESASRMRVAWRRLREIWVDGSVSHQLCQDAVHEKTISPNSAQ